MQKAHNCSQGQNLGLEFRSARVVRQSPTMDKRAECLGLVEGIFLKVKNLRDV
jgi:hypothetical protein